MKFISAILLSLAAKVFSEDELPITTSDVFVQSGEISESSAVVMIRCNNEHDSAVSLYLDGEVEAETQAFMAKDYTVSFEVDGLDSNTEYSYSATCEPLDGVSPSVDSMGATFKTAPSADDKAHINFVWAADLAGQGWGRNPDFEVVTVNGDVSTAMMSFCISKLPFMSCNT